MSGNRNLDTLFMGNPLRCTADCGAAQFMSYDLYLAKAPASRPGAKGPSTMRTSTPRKTDQNRGGPTSRKGQARAAQILKAARQVLVEAGYTQFSLRNIAAQAGMHLSNLQYYYPTREQILLALLHYILEDYNIHFEERYRDLP